MISSSLNFFHKRIMWLSNLFGSCFLSAAPSPQLGVGALLLQIRRGWACSAQIFQARPERSNPRSRKKACCRSSFSFQP